jgi:hypothetical protein
VNPVELAAAGPRAAGHELRYAELIADIVEGARLHYELDRADPDPDLALLEGDERYARGLAKLAELGDLEATAELADIISLVAQAHASGDAELAGAVWEAGAVSVGWGTDDALQAAKAGARAGAPQAAHALRAAARERRGAAAPTSSAVSRD